MKLIKLPLFLLFFLLVGCATQKLSQPLPTNEIIGVSSQLNAYPNISYIGTTVFNNKPEGMDKQFGLNVNQMMGSYLYSQLHSFGYSSVHRINKLLAPNSKNREELIKPSTKTIQQFMKSQNINTLVVILPGSTDFIQSGLDSMYNPDGYGLFKHSLAIFHTAFVYGSYSINVYQAPDAKLIARQHRLIKQKIQLSPWNSNTSSLTSAERKDLKDFVQQQLLPAMQEDSLAVLDLSSK